MPVSDVDLAVLEIDKQLPEMARTVIRDHLDLTDPANREFLDEPDGREQHQTEWHQWGIVTHTRIFLRHYDEDLVGYLRDWRLWEAVDARLRVEIDDVSRARLLRISILLHDIGKFGSRTRGRVRFHFWNHESLSGEVIRAELDLERFGLTPAQVRYIARTAEDHFVLGLMRKRAREKGAYDPTFLESEEFRRIAEGIRDAHPDDYVEIGVLFLGDSLSKADPVNGPERALSQHEINIGVARRYLEIVLEGEATC